MGAKTRVEASCAKPELGHGRRIWVRINGGIFGPGIRNLLIAIDSLGNIRLAAEEIKISYSKAYLLLNHFENDSGCRLLNRQLGGAHGGSSTLTETAKDIIARYDAFMEESKNLLQEALDRSFSDFEPRDVSKQRPRR